VLLEPGPPGSRSSVAGVHAVTRRERAPSTGPETGQTIPAERGQCRHFPRLPPAGRLAQTRWDVSCGGAVQQEGGNILMAEEVHPKILARPVGGPGGRAGQDPGAARRIRLGGFRGGPGGRGTGGGGSRRAARNRPGAAARGLQPPMPQAASASPRRKRGGVRGGDGRAQPPNRFQETGRSRNRFDKNEPNEQVL